MPWLDAYLTSDEPFRKGVTATRWTPLHRRWTDQVRAMDGAWGSTSTCARNMSVRTVVKRPVRATVPEGKGYGFPRLPTLSYMRKAKRVGVDTSIVAGIILPFQSPDAFRTRCRREPTCCQVHHGMRHLLQA